MEKRTIGIREKLPVLQSLPLSFQHLTAMFGATILVPILVGIDPAILFIPGLPKAAFRLILDPVLPLFLRFY
jgi:uracil permease